LHVLGQIDGASQLMAANDETNRAKSIDSCGNMVDALMILTEIYSVTTLPEMATAGTVVKGGDCVCVGRPFE
jgi:hypothetical protein